MKKSSLTLFFSIAITGCLQYGGATVGTSFEIKSYTIDEGISATINSQSGFSYKNGEGVITFSGEGVFHIDRKSANKTPLILDIEGIRLRCEDGEFYITTYHLVDGPGNGKPGSAKLTVFQGKVEIENAGPKAFVEDEGVRIYRDSVSRLINWIPKEHTYWVNSFYQYEQLPLYELKGILNRWFHIKAGLLPQDADSMVRHIHLKQYEDISLQLYTIAQDNRYLITWNTRDSITIRHK